MDIAFNATGRRAGEYSNGKPFSALSVEEFMTPVDTVLRANFVTAQAVARRMAPEGRGVIIFLTGSPARPHGPGTSAVGAAFGAIENLTRSLAIELGSAGVRTVCVRTSANPDSRTISDTVDLMVAMTGMKPEQAAAAVVEGRLLPYSPHTADTARAVVLLASDRTKMMTGTVLNASAGGVAD